MELQTLFYIVGIAMMVTIIVSFILIGITIWNIKKQLNRLPTIAKTAIAGFTIAKRKELLSVAGVTLGTAFLGKIKNFIDSKTK